jgi:kynureninase
MDGMNSTSRERAESLDDGDPLAGFRDRFVIADPDLIYLDGNSLGRLPRSTAPRLRQAIEEEWGGELIRGWSHWIELSREVGDLIGTALIGARPGEVTLSDSTTVNLYKLAAAALDARPGRRVILTDDDNFPTDRYVLAGLADVRHVRTDIDGGIRTEDVLAALDSDVALVSLSHLAYRSGAIADMPAITAAAHAAGALTLWDLSHSGGSVPVDLTGSGADLAVGCTYKYLNGGPGSPAYLYVRAELAPELRQPIQGWFGTRDQFGMGPDYEPADGIDRFLVGTPPVLGAYAVHEGVAVLAEAGIGRLRLKGQALTAYLIELAESWLWPLGFRLASPADADRRGSHVSLHHPHAWQISQALTEAGVLGDYRTPDRLRLGPAPAYTRFVDVHAGMAKVREIVASGAYEKYPASIGRVT